jgi:hypothetical protein
VFEIVKKSNSVLFQFSAECPPVHAKSPGCFGNIEITLGQHFVDALPFQGLD